LRRTAAGVVTTLALAYGGICALMFVAQRSLLYYPVPARAPAGTPSLALPSGGEVLRVWARPADGPRALIYFGGNAEDVSGNLDEFAAALPGRALYFVSYRGYGGSTGAPSESALFADALAVYDHLRARHADIAVVGRSLGSGVAVYLAHERPVSRLVLVTPYDSIANVAAGIYPFLPVRWLIRDPYDSASRIARVRAPTLVVVAEHDEVIPRARTDALVARFPQGQARVELIRGATHNALDYEALLPAFLGS
jgi:pimeloyl-ACP methyl ester carboxylesterase